MISRLFLPQGRVFGRFRLEVRIILAGLLHKEQVAPGVSVHAGPRTEIRRWPGRDRHPDRAGSESPGRGNSSFRLPAGRSSTAPSTAIYEPADSRPDERLFLDPGRCPGKTAARQKADASPRRCLICDRFWTSRRGSLVLLGNAPTPRPLAPALSPGLSHTPAGNRAASPICAGKSPLAPGRRMNNLVLGGVNPAESR